MFTSRSLIAFTAFVSVALAATLQGSANITPQDYYGLPAAALANNPPACGMPYSQLNLARITAVQNMDTSKTCNLCLKVVNVNNPLKYVYVLAVDLGGSGLDLSIPSFKYLFDQQYDAAPASWSTVDSSYCSGIYTPGQTNPNQGIGAGTSTSAVTTTTTKKTTVKPTTTTTTTTTTTKKTTVKPTTTTVKHTTTTSKSTTKKSSTKKTSTTTSKRSSSIGKTTTKKSSTKKSSTKKISTTTSKRSSSIGKTTTRNSGTSIVKHTTKKTSTSTKKAPASTHKHSTKRGSHSKVKKFYNPSRRPHPRMI